MEIKVKVTDIDYCIKKSDALIVYMKNGKVWVCEIDQEMPKNNELFTTLILKTARKDKCEN